MDPSLQHFQTQFTNSAGGLPTTNNHHPPQHQQFGAAGFSLQDLMRNADPYLQQQQQQQQQPQQWSFLQQLQQQASAMAAAVGSQIPSQQQQPQQQSQNSSSIVRFYPPQQAANQQQQMLQVLRAREIPLNGINPMINQGVAQTKGILMATPVQAILQPSRRGAELMCENAMPSEQLSNMLLNLVQSAAGSSGPAAATATGAAAMQSAPSALQRSAALPNTSKSTANAPSGRSASKAPAPRPAKRLKKAESKDVSTGANGGGAGAASSSSVAANTNWDNLKHKESEVRRRVKIREKYEDLKRLSGCKRADRRSILNDVCEKLVENDREIRKFMSMIEEQERAALGNLPAGVSAPVAIIDGSTVPVHVGVGVMARTSRQQAPAAGAGGDPKILKSIPPCLVVPNCDPEALGTESLMDAVDFQTLFQFAGVGIAVTKLDGTFVECNDTFCRVVGQDRLTLLQSNLFLQSSRGDQDFAHLVETTKSLIRGSKPPSLPPQTHEHTVHVVNYLGSQLRLVENSITCRLSLIRSFGEAKYFMVVVNL
eukprot:TRINITY_DN3132_c0_g1_i1.p1 TRINITY_DN3132_c0_g1~~TRINITY_DN3132_c0_g1_i1.p1  ORF type:complete len:548 (-),score=133.81 TRINITY_DN3132_c0_g1_i1:1073-2695(-)